MRAERPILSPLSISDPTIPSQRPHHDPEQDITALPQMGYPQTDPWARYRRPSTDTIDNIPTPTNAAPPAHARVTVVEQTTELESFNTAPPPYSVRQKQHRHSRFPVKAQNISSAPPQSNRAIPVTVNGAPNETFHEVPLGGNDDLEKAKITTQYNGLQGAWRFTKSKLIVSAVIAIVVTTVVVTTALEMTKKHPEEFGKI